MSDFKKVFKSAFYMYMVQGLNFLVPFLILPYLLKTLSVQSFGVYSFAFAFTQFVLLFVDFGFNISATKKIAENYDNSLFIIKSFWNIIFIKFFLAIIALIFVIIGIVFIIKLKVYSSAILFSFIMVLGTVFFPVWWFQGVNRIKELACIATFSKIVTYPLMFILVKQKNDFNLAIIIQSLSFLFSGSIALIYIFKNDSNYFKNISLPSFNEVIHEIKEAFPIFLSNSSISLYTNSVTIFLGFFSTDYNVGLFGAMERVVRAICFGILGPLNQVVFPMLIRQKSDNYNQALKFFEKLLYLIFFLMVVSYLLFYVLKPYLLEHFFRNYFNISLLLNVFMIMIFPIALGGVFGQLGLLGLGNEKDKKYFSKIYIIVGILSVPFTLGLIKFYQLRGAILAMLIVEIVIFILFSIYFYRNIFPRRKL
ncbi:oligosaccharide flippase family protein [Flavobacterium oreochromis]|uniref:oligosaccharide flippase family protein n=1 Tax=Flavobacterium oreochromis TaxID=2906078 RepID=UPI00385DF2C1